jgi:hypothetical protein
MLPLALRDTLRATTFPFTRALGITIIVGLSAIGSVAVPAAAAVAAYPTALYAAIGRDDDVALCAEEGHQAAQVYARRAFAVSTARLRRGTMVYIAEGRDECVRGAHNSMLVAYVASGPGTYRQVLRDLAYEQTFRADGSAVTSANDGASVTLRMTYLFDGTSYRVVRAEKVYADTGEVKPLSISLHFAPGTSALSVSGRVYRAFGDSYSLAAKAGQTLSVRTVPGRGKLSLRVSSPSGADLTNGRSGNGYRGYLPQSGKYTIVVEGANDDSTASTYTMTIGVR